MKSKRVARYVTLLQTWVLDDRMKRMIMDLQRHWLTDYQQSREKLLVEMTERVS